MTIFSNVAKSFLIDALNEHIKGSIEKDAPPPSFFVYLAPKRDKELARKKRGCLQGLVHTLETFPTYNSDLETVRALIAYFDHCKTHVDEASSSRNHAPGTTEALLAHLLNFIKVFYKRTSQLALIDQEDEKDTFSHFSSVIASYHARRIMDTKTQPGLLQSTLTNPAITPIIAFEQALDRCVNDTYLFARRNLERQNKTDMAHFNRIKTELGALCIELLQLKHDKMHADHKLTFYALCLPHYLSDYLIHAQQVTQGQNASTSFAESVDEDDFSLFDIPSAESEERQAIEAKQQIDADEEEALSDEQTNTL